ncbi:probable zinc protease PqqL [Coccomyxa sp. Obi]|nr:probable zinc protease PqqL [Coccomyxa sp. Obi]
MAAEFRRLPGIELSADEWNERPALGPTGVRHGHLKNGLRYYVCATTKPKQRAALALVVRIGSAVEEEHERGLAHIVEHLAFNATDAFHSHEIVKFLESIGAKFGACQNAYTSVDETVYELTVPSDDPKLLEQAFAVLAQFATSIRCSPEDLAKERGAVLEEWRMGKDSAGRAQEAHWELILQGSKYANRLPIGLKDVIQCCSADVVRAFFERWYRPEHQAVIATGDFDPDAVVAMLTEKLEGCKSRDKSPAPVIPRCPLAPHNQPRFKVFIDKEAQQSLLHVSFKMDTENVTTPAEYLCSLREDLFQTAMNSRFFRIGRRPDPPFYNAQIGSEQITATIRSVVLTASTQEKNTLRALEALLSELASVRLHGFSDREIKAAIDFMMSDAESLYIERDQAYAEELRGEYVRHFLSGEFVMDRRKEAHLCKTMLTKIGKEDGHAFKDLAKTCRSTHNMVVKTVSHRRVVSEEDLAEVVQRVDQAEVNGEIGPPDTQADVPTSIIPAGKEPQPGEIVERHHFPKLGATELVLSNGMKVCYKVTDLLDDQILLTGLAAGGLTEVPMSEYRTASFGVTLAMEMGLFGLKPEVQMDMLMGKRCGISVQEGAYWRSIGGEQAPVDLETGLQLIYALFTTSVTPVPAELDTCMQYLREVTLAQLRNPMRRFADRVRQLIFQDCYFYRPFSLRDLASVDPHQACAHFNRSFRNPAEFSLCFTGSLKVDEFEDLVKRYLAAIPAADSSLPDPKSPDKLTPLEFQFPEGVIREDVRVSMVEHMSQALIAFPVRLFMMSEDGLPSGKEAVWLYLVCKLLETKLMQKLRFEFGEVYTVSVAPSFSAEAPCSAKNYTDGDVAIAFSCDPDNAHRLIEMALSEMERLQEEGPSAEDVTTVLTLDQRSWETEQQENSFWHTNLVSSYKSRTYNLTKDLDVAYTRRIEAREAVRAEADAASVQAALCRVFPMPCRSRYVALSLLPQKPLLKRMVESTAGLLPSRDRSPAYWITAAAVITVAAFVLLHHR